MIEQSAVTGFLDKYYAKNPLDHSDSGIVARYTGMTKEQAEIALGLVEYNLFLAKYHPKEKGPEKPLKTEDYQYESTTVIAESIPNAILRMLNGFKNQRLATIAA